MHPDPADSLSADSQTVGHFAQESDRDSFQPIEPLLYGDIIYRSIAKQPDGPHVNLRSGIKPVLQTELTEKTSNTTDTGSVPDKCDKITPIDDTESHPMKRIGKDKISRGKTRSSGLFPAGNDTESLV